MESKCISVGAKLETNIEEFDNLKKDFAKIVEKITLRRSMLRKIKIFMTSVIVYGNFARIAMTSLVRSQKILPRSLGNLIHSSLGCVVNMRI